MELEAPIANLNGTGRKFLFENLLTAYEAVGAAILALSNTAPHGRDYPKGPDSYNVAREQHSRRIEALKQVQEELSAIAIKL